MLKNSYISLIARVVVGLMFIIVGASKIGNTASFANEIGNYDMLPGFTLNFLALTLPWIEVFVGILLILGIKLKANSMLSSALLLAFTLAVAIAFARGLNIECGCYSSIAEQTVGWTKILQNTGLLLLSLYVYFHPGDKLILAKE